MIYTLPPLPYQLDALEPLMSQETLEYHYGKHLQTYVDNLNRLIIDTPQEDMTLEEIILTTTGATFNNAAQVWNHTFFFNSLSPEPSIISEKFGAAVHRDFGSFERFEDMFKKAALGIFGSGWAWLAADNEGKLHILKESNAGNPMTSGYKPLLTIDVWEHAYYIDCRNRRGEFIEKCWDLINWEKVSKRYEAIGLASVTVDSAAAQVPPVPMDRYVCITCGWVYDPLEGDPENGIPAGTPFEQIPEEWVCPACGVGKEMFEKER